MCQLFEIARSENGALEQETTEKGARIFFFACNAYASHPKHGILLTSPANLQAPVFHESRLFDEERPQHAVDHFLEPKIPLGLLGIKTF